MSQPKLRFVTPHDLLVIKSMAKDYLIQLPTGSVLEGHGKSLDDGDRVALAYVHAVLTYVGEPGLHIQIRTHEPLEHDPV